jgi:hypothetical protein
MEDKIGLILISTGKYDQFVQPLITSASKYFFPGQLFSVYLFTDKPDMDITNKRENMFFYEIPSYEFPWATLLRYEIITRFKEEFHSKYLFYIDVDMLFVDIVREEILCDGLTAILHPGYWNGGWGSRKTRSESLAYLDPSLWHNYCCGGFQGGKREDYLEAASIMAEKIHIDLDTARDMGYEQHNGILAEWHDESFWNHYLKYYTGSLLILPPSYCYPESWRLPFEKKILALDKNHKEIRS